MPASNVDVPRLDRRVLDEIRELQSEDAPDLLRQVVELFLADAPNHLAAIRVFARRGDTEALARAAHTLKSASASVGLIRFSGLCKTIELACRAGSVAGLPQDLPALENEWCLAGQALRDAVAKVSP